NKGCLTCSFRKTDENFNSHLILTRCSVFKDQTIHDDIQFGITPCSISSYFVANFISAATFLIYHISLY
ncbi:hypothetical protein, partial [Paenibacillus macerans]|uniref:hypothetical protein n=1 Tax=Paenibacillus macerans TaxID=44252 RepID=UPI00227F6ECD